MKVLVLHSLPPASLGGRSAAEFDLAVVAQDIADVLPGAVVAGVRGEVDEIVDAVKIHGPDVVFNTCEAPLGRPDLEAHVAALLEWLGVPFTGSGSETLALCRRKDRTKGVLAAAGVLVPRANVFPCIVKPAAEDGSAGIDLGSVCEDETARDIALARLDAPALVEEFLPGREFAVSLWGRRQPEYFSLMETRFRNGLRLNTYASKWDEDSAEFINSPHSYAIDIRPELRASVLAAAAASWNAVGARGYLTVDVRFDGCDRPHVLDVNPNSDLGPGVGIVRAAEEIGWTWQRFVRQQVEWAQR